MKVTMTKDIVDFKAKKTYDVTKERANYWFGIGVAKKAATKKTTKKK